MLYRLKPVTPDAPKRSNRKPPTKAPTIPSAMLSQKPWPCLSTILLPIKPAIRPSMIQLMMPMSSSFLNPDTHNSNRQRSWSPTDVIAFADRVFDALNRRTPCAFAPPPQRQSSAPPAVAALLPLVPHTSASGARSDHPEIPERRDERRLFLC